MEHLAYINPLHSTRFMTIRVPYGKPWEFRPWDIYVEMGNTFQLPIDYSNGAASQQPPNGQK